MITYQFKAGDYIRFTIRDDSFDGLIGKIVGDDGKYYSIEIEGTLFAKGGTPGFSAGDFNHISPLELLAREAADEISPLELLAREAADEE